MREGEEGKDWRERGSESCSSEFWIILTHTCLSLCRVVVQGSTIQSSTNSWQRCVDTTALTVHINFSIPLNTLSHVQ